MAVRSERELGIRNWEFGVSEKAWYAIGLFCGLWTVDCLLENA
jgi:hypothetical protein